MKGSKREKEKLKKRKVVGEKGWRWGGKGREWKGKRYGEGLEGKGSPVPYLDNLSNKWILVIFPYSPKCRNLFYL